jgi:hypothetical protein
MTSVRIRAERLGRSRSSSDGWVRCGGTPTLFIDGIVHRGSYDATTLWEALAR